MRSPVNSPQRPVTRSFDNFFDLRVNERLSKQSWGWWFETPSSSLWRHCNVTTACLASALGPFDFILGILKTKKLERLESNLIRTSFVGNIDLNLKACLQYHLYTETSYQFCTSIGMLGSGTQGNIRIIKRYFSNIFPRTSMFIALSPVKAVHEDSTVVHPISLELSQW